MSATLKSQIIMKQRKKAGLPVYNFGLGANPIPISTLFSKEIKKHLDKKDYVSACGVDEFQNAIKNDDQDKIKSLLDDNNFVVGWICPHCRSEFDNDDNIVEIFAGMQGKGES